MVMSAVLGGAFLGGLGDRMRENREYTKSKTDEMQTFLLQTGLKRQNEVASARQKLTEATDFLSSKGLDESNLLALLDNNPKEVIRLYGAALKAEARGDLNATKLNESIILSAGYTTPDMSPSELIKAATPDFVQGSDLEKPAEREGSVLQKMFKTPGIQEIMYDAYSSDVLGLGAKGKDIQASATADLFQKGTTGSSGSVQTDLGVFADQDDEYDSVQKRDMRVQIQEEYNERLKSQKIELTNSLENTTLTDDEKKIVEDRIRKLDDLEEMIRSGSKNRAYQELIKMYDDIAKHYYNTNPLGRLVLNDSSNFGLNPTEIEDLFGE